MPNTQPLFFFVRRYLYSRTLARRTLCAPLVLSTVLAIGVSACSKSTPQQAETPVASHSAQAVPSSATHKAGVANSNSSESMAQPAPPVATAESLSAATVNTSEPSTERPTSEGAEPALIDSKGDALPQTETRPSLDSPSFKHRLELLVSAIGSNQPETALPAFFPQVAYAQVKAIKDPQRDWQRRLVAAFSRNIAEYHKQLGNPPSLKLVRLELPETKVKWIKPGVEGNRLGYYRVTRSKLVVEKSDGQQVRLELTSLISWRGEWYVVHLHGFD